MEPEILRKLGALLREGIEGEPQAVYLMAAIRKLLEQQGAKQQYYYLNFHCNWALHSKLSGDAAQKVLKHFDEANTHLKTGKQLHQLPRHLQNEIDKLSKMKRFENELKAFLQANRLPAINAARSDGWVYFLHFYANVISDCPLVIAADNTAAGIKSVTVKVELANQAMHDHMMFKVTWEVLDKNGLFGSIDIYNSFALNPKVA
jgi:hypothetical protein